MSASTRLRLRVSPGAAEAAVRSSELGEPAGIEPDEIERRLAMAGGQEHETV